MSGSIALVGQRRDKTTLLQRSSNRGKDGKHTHQAIVLAREDARDVHTEHRIEQLHHAVAQTTPKNATGRLVLQRWF